MIAQILLQLALEAQFVLWLSLLTTPCPSRSIELKKDTVIVVLGASGDLAKKKTVIRIYAVF